MKGIKLTVAAVYQILQNVVYINQQLTDVCGSVCVCIQSDIANSF